MTTYAELATATNFSFLRGASQAKDLVLKAIELGHAGIGIADRNTVAGVVRAYAALNQVKDAVGEAALAGFKLAVGARLVFADGSPDIIAYPADRDGWGRLCRLLTLGNRKAKKGECILVLDDLLADTRGLLLIVMPERSLDNLPAVLARVAEAAAGAVWLGCAMHRRGDDRRRLARLFRIGEAAGVALIAVNDVLYHAPEQRDLQDVMSCIREGTTIEAAGRLLEVNADRHLKEPREMARLFRDRPEAIDETQHLLGRVEFSLDQLTYEYPDEPVPPGWTPQGWLTELTWRRAEMRYPQGVPDKVVSLIGQELQLIEKLDYARYFLTIYDIVQVANGKGILCQGRGSAANSAVCYVLGITAVDPNEHDVLFARFLSSERREPPDIDVDFEHERREEIIQHIYERYGRARAGIAATVISYRPRSAIRDVGKAMGLTEDITARLAGMIWGSWGEGISDEQICQAGLDPANATVRRAVDLAIRLLGFPRHLSQHVGGFVLSRERLDETVPIGNAAMPDRTFIEWDRDDIDSLQLMKVDVLALGMLTCIRKAFELIEGYADLIEGHERRRYQLADFKDGDEATYKMLQEGKSLGVFQVESRAQMNMLPRLKPREFYDLVIQVAIVRPGPIQGDMVHPYLRRRARLEEVNYPAPAPGKGDENELYEVLRKTFGVPLFQEQAMRLAMVAAQFTEVEANGLRRAMATFRNVGTIGNYETMMVERMVERGYERAFAQRCFDQIKGFGSYGFPESHAASFAKLVYISSYLKCWHPAAFACALLNSQPMGFYAPAQIVREAQENGRVEPRPIDVNHSAWDNGLERFETGLSAAEAGEMPKEPHPFALRLGFCQIEGFKEKWGEAIAEARQNRPYRDVEELMRRADLPARAMHALADADAFRSLGLDRREALWAVRRLPDDDALPLFQTAKTRELGWEAHRPLPAMPQHEHVVADYQTTRLSLKGHPVGFLRSRLSRDRILSCADIDKTTDGAWARIAGVPLVRQRPGNGNAIFVTLEDETGVVNVVIWARLFERFRREVMSARLMLVEGRVQRSPEGVTHLMAQRIIDRSADLLSLSDTHRAEMEPRIDELKNPPMQRHRHPRDVRILPRSRDFH